jgi:hypothetical protein
MYRRITSAHFAGLIGFFFVFGSANGTTHPRNAKKNAYASNSLKYGKAEYFYNFQLPCLAMPYLSK